MSESPERIKEWVRQEGLALGFDAVGFAAPDDGGTSRKALGAYLSQGLHGDMEWMERTAERRGSPLALWPEARTVIALALNYGPAEDPMRRLELADRGTISVYAQGHDYHDLMKARAKRLASAIHDRHGIEVKVFVDTAPVMEKPVAERAGIGWQGKHTNLVSRDFGSWLFLAEIFLDLELPPDRAEADHCGSCHRCLDICPTDAFPAPYRIDPRRCLSYLTIEHKGPIPREFRAAMGNRIYGCDDCLAVCPWNKYARRTKEYAFLPRAELTAPRLADLAQLDDAGFRRLFSGSAIKRLGRDRFVRNVAIALGNSGGRSGAGDAVRRLIDDASPLVRGAAAWAAGRLFDREEVARLAALHAAHESEPAVRDEWRAAAAIRSDP